MTPPELPPLWHQQPKESNVAYGAFLVYRDLPPNNRSSQQVASEYARNWSLIRRWSARWFWVERVQAYDAFQAEEHRKGQLAERGKMSERQATEAQVIQRVLFAPVRALAVKLADLIDREELDQMPVADLYALSLASARLWPAVARAEREARGAPVPEYVPVDETPEALPGGGLVLTEEFLAEVHFALEQANLAPRQLAPGDDSIDVTPTEEPPDA